MRKPKRIELWDGGRKIKESDNYDDIWKMYQDGDKVYEIYDSRMNADSVNAKGGRPRKITPKVMEAAIAMFYRRETYTEIGRKLGISGNHIRSVLIKEGYTR